MAEGTLDFILEELITLTNLAAGILFPDAALQAMEADYLALVARDPIAAALHPCPSVARLGLAPGQPLPSTPAEIQGYLDFVQRRLRSAPSALDKAVRWMARAALRNALRAHDTGQDFADREVRVTVRRHEDHSTAKFRRILALVLLEPDRRPDEDTFEALERGFGIRGCAVGYGSTATACMEGAEMSVRVDVQFEGCLEDRKVFDEVDRESRCAYLHWLWRIGELKRMDDEE